VSFHPLHETEKSLMRELPKFLIPTTAALAVVFCPVLAHAQAAPEQGPPPSYQAQYEPQQGYGQPPQGYGQPPPNNYPPPGYSNYPPPPPPRYGYPPPRGYGRPVVYAPPVYQHDGFYLHMHLGGGYTSMTATSNGDKFTLSGGSVAIGIAAGGVIAPNLILYGTFYDTVITDPNVAYNGVNAGVMGGSSASLYGIGIGLAYYLMPVNVFFMGALTATKMDDSDSYDNYNYFNTDFGLGFQGQVGKEWWVARDWGLGVAAEVTLATMKDSYNQDVRWSGGSFSILFSATCN